MSTYHIPVMPKEVLKYLDVKPNYWYVDCNLGGGGHTEGILSVGGKVLGIDLDSDAISEVSKKYKLRKQILGGRESFISDDLIIAQDNFANIKNVIASASETISVLDSGSSTSGMTVRGILFDLGVSSFQLENKDRGFSFNMDAELDMRMNQSSSSPKAKDLVNALHEGELSELFFKLGEENFAKKIARKIVEYRKTKLIETTNELAKIILSARPRSTSDRTHPATRVFQALRIAVNDELNSLKEALPNALSVLDKGGRMVVISFHSLEDRIVKNFFKEWEKKGFVKSLTKKPIEPTDEETLQNPRARSGKLRVIKKR